MKKYQIFEVSRNIKKHAVSKAPDDVGKIGEKLGFEKVLITKNNESYDFKSKVNRQIKFFQDWKNAYDLIEKNSIILLQHPYRTHQLGREHYLLKLKKQKHVKFICLIHDVEELRNTIYNEYYKDEFQFMLKIFDILIVHNDSMREYFLNKGIDSSKIIVLNIFDYLIPNYKSKNANFDKSIIIAGNLDVKKSSYIGKLNQVHNNFKLYGPNYSLHEYKNCEYKGSLPSDEIPSVLAEGFGLIWDGNSIENCTGPTGSYLKYNNPHKLSLYLASELPVIIWKEAAEAKFVEENNVGLTVNNLLEISPLLDKLTKKQYDVIAQNAKVIGQKLRKGYYTSSAINAAIKSLEK